MTPISSCVKRECAFVNLYDGTKFIKNKIVQYGAVVVVNDDSNEFEGVLTVADIAKKTHNIIADCLTEKPKVNLDTCLTATLNLMLQYKEDVLPVFNNDKFYGLIFKSDIATELSKSNVLKSEMVKEGVLKLAENEKTLKAIYDNTNSIRLMIDTDERIIFYNKRALENSVLFMNNLHMKTGVLLADVIKNKFFEEGSFREGVKKAFSGNRFVKELKIWLDDSSYWFLTECFPVSLEKEILAVSISIREITEKKKRELLIKKQNETLRSIIYQQSHELRKPIANILGVVDIVDLSELSEHNKKLFEHLKNLSKEVDQVIRKIVSKAESDLL